MEIKSKSKCKIHFAVWGLYAVPKREVGLKAEEDVVWLKIRKEDSHLKWREQGILVPRIWEDPVRGEGPILFPNVVLLMANTLAKPPGTIVPSECVVMGTMINDTESKVGNRIKVISMLIINCIRHSQ